MKTSVVIFTYRKIDILQEIFLAIKKYSPPKIYIISNLAKNEDEFLLINQVQEYITNYDFETEKIIISPSKHVGIKDVFKFGLDAVFQTEDQIIILEDDTVPNSSFFSFCNKMLTKYKDDKTIGVISGCNLNAIENRNIYIKSDYCVPLWGWATWKRSWKYYKIECEDWMLHRELIIPSLKHNVPFFIERMDNFFINPVAWDFQVTLMLWINKMKNIVPGVNLITNKGFIPLAHYTQYPNSKFSLLKRNEVDVQNLHYSHNVEYEETYALKGEELMLEVKNHMH